MDRHRAQVIVKRVKSILMIKHHFDGREFWALPGGGVEADETPAEAALRELQEECLVTGKLMKQLSEYVYVDGSKVFTFQVDIGEQEPQLGTDPEFPADDQAILEVGWLQLDEMIERDRAFVLAAGLFGIQDFVDEILSWGDDVSYPRLRDLD